jgi:predicted HTH transcriptional regulator/tetratricopeptide (TPR) repeat protein
MANATDCRHPENGYPENALKIFLGHSKDAISEAKAILNLESVIQKELNRLQEVMVGIPNRYSQVKIWQWNADAKPNVGGQKITVSPNLDIADISVFIFKNKVGNVTWEELDRYRNNSNTRNANTRIIALFPEEPPPADIICTPDGAQNWANLKKREIELTENWNKECSNSITPAPRYKDILDIENILIEQINRILNEILKSASKSSLQENNYLHKDDTIIKEEFRTALDDTHYLDKPCSPVRVDELNWDLVKTYAEKTGININSLTKFDAAKKLGLVHPYADNYQYVTRTAVIAFSDRPSDFIDQASIKIRIDKENNKYDLENLSFSLVKLAETCLSRVLGTLGEGYSDNDGFQRQAIYEIPEQIIRELLSNALVHRDYESKGCITVRINKNQIEILSPGGSASEPYNRMLKSGSSVPLPRNTTLKKIAEASLLYEGSGKGFRIFHEYVLDKGEKSLTWEIHEVENGKNTTKVTLKRPDMFSHFSYPSAKSERIFISYSHDSDEHQDFVRGITDQLRQGGINCIIDKDVSSFPSEGWQRWMEKQINKAEFVLLICTPNYLKRYRGNERESNRSVTFEGLVISQMLYDSYYQNTKFIPVIPKNGSSEHVPLALKGRASYHLPTDYDKLYRVLTGQAEYVAPSLDSAHSMPAINTQKSTRIHSDRLPTIKGEFFGRVDELQLLNDAWAGNDTRMIQFIGPGGTGKTKLLRHWLDHTDNIDVLIAWSFYSQGASEDRQISATPFFSHAFEKLGSTRDMSSFTSDEDKGEHLADLLRNQHSVLVLDGLEPLQHASKGMRGELKDRAMRQLLKSLAGQNNGLCIITTRIAVHELSDRTHVHSNDLQNLAPADGILLLKSLQVKGNNKTLEKAVMEYGCHALALTLLGNLLHQRYDGDILKRDLLKALVKEDGNQTSRYAFKVMQAYEEWFASDSQLAPELALLHLLGLFDHPIEKEVLQVLWDAQIPKLTAGVSADHWQDAIAALREDHHLLSQHKSKEGKLSDQLDCHPLIREYFGQQLRETQPDAWRQAHKRLYDYYKALPEKERPDTVAEMQPLFSAVAHGCAAGLHQQALDEVYWPRIHREGEAYIVKKLGAFSDDLAALAHFFTIPWQTPATGLTEAAQTVALSWAGFHLRALGRLREALSPMQASVEMYVKKEHWKDAAIGASNFSELQLTLGDVAAATVSSQQSVVYADQSADMFQRMSRRATHADALHQSGETAQALERFIEAEQLHQERQLVYPRLYSVQGFQYCDLLLAQDEVVAALERAEQMLKWVEQGRGSLLDIALNQLTLGRAYYQKRNFSQATDWLDQAVAGLRKAGRLDYLPLGLLARAVLYRDNPSAHRDFACASQDLQEVYEIAEPSGMRLHLTDFHLEMARLLITEQENPSQSPVEKSESVEFFLQKHIIQAAKLIEETGYKRRLPELQALQHRIAEFK